MIRSMAFNSSISIWHTWREYKICEIPNVFTKGSEPKFSDEVYTIVKTSGKKVILDDQTTNLRYNWLQVPNDSVTTNTNVKSQIKQKKI
jgi:hypothetical protein